MRVRISHGMDLKDVPLKIKELLSEGADSLDKKVRLIVNLKDMIGDGTNIEYVIAIVQQLRGSIADVDSILADVQSISEGYNAVINNPELEPESPATTQETPPDVREG